MSEMDQMASRRPQTASHSGSALRHLPGERVGWLRSARLLLAVLIVGLLLLPAAPIAAAEDWTITSYDVEITIQPDGSMDIVEAIDVDFGTLEKHGIFREIPIRYRFNDDQDRIYRIDFQGVTDANDRTVPYSTSRSGAMYRIRIGDPDRTVSGPQSYRLWYTIDGALNGFETHDELFWNVSGVWVVPILSWSTQVNVPGITEVACFQGSTGSREACPAELVDGRAIFHSNRGLADGEQFTIVVGFEKGYVPEPQPILTERERTVEDFFQFTPAVQGGMVVTGVLGVAGLVALYWTRGRDQRFTSIHYLTQDPTEERRGLFERDQVVIEFQPPEQMRPAQMGVLIDERADLQDMTATIIDLAVRGYLKITELPEQGFLWAKKKNWELERLPKSDGDLLRYEQRLLRALFKDKDRVRISELRNTFYKDLNAARSLLYKDVTQRKWFIGNPDHVRARWVMYGVLAAIVAAGIGAALGFLFGAALVALPLVLAGLAMALLSPAMPRRSALGSELLRRTAGFRQYMETAEKDRQRFFEQSNIFAEYLPYAMVLGIVDRWVRAFEGIDVQAATAYWYAGHGIFNPREFSSEMRDFSTVAGSALSSTPGSSGSSGFSGGGGAGGGGGGGGGGSW